MTRFYSIVVRDEKIEGKERKEKRKRGFRKGGDFRVRSRHRSRGVEVLLGMSRNRPKNGSLSMRVLSQKVLPKARGTAGSARARYITSDSPA
jgi:hypothetical protein